MPEVPFGARIDRIVARVAVIAGVLALVYLTARLAPWAVYLLRHTHVEIVGVQ